MFPPAILAKYLPMYNVDTDVLDNWGFGHCIQRQRRYSTLHLRTDFRLIRKMADLQPCLGRDRDTTSHTWDQYLVASGGELAQELAWANSSLPNSPSITREDENSYDKSLNHWEKAHLDKCRLRAPGHAFTLSQDADKRKCWSNASHMHTVIANTHMLWADSHDRFLTTRETFSLQGFPVYPAHISYQNGRGALCSLN